MQVLEALNNAIVRLSAVSGRGSAAARLADDWTAWYFDNQWRSAGVVGVPLIYGASNGYWQRYRSAYDQLSAQERAQVPPPDAVEPTAARLFGAAGVQTVEANEAAADAAMEAAKTGARVTVDAIDEVEKRALRGAWLLVIPVALSLWLARRG